MQARPQPAIRRSSQRCRTTRCSKSCSARRSAISGKAPIPSAAWPSTGAPRENARTTAVAVGGSGFGVMALIVAAERGWVTRKAALERLGRMLEFFLQARCYHGAYPALHERTHGRDHRLLAQGRRGGPRRDVLSDDGPALRTPVFRSRHAGGSGCEIANLDSLERRRVELVYARRSRGTVLALEPVQRLGDGSRDSRLERVPHHIRACGFVAALSDRAGGLSPRVRERARISQRQILVRHRAAPRHELRRPAVLHPLLVLRARSARAHGPIRRLLGAERASRPHQPRSLRRESGQIRRATANPAGA